MKQRSAAHGGNNQDFRGVGQSCLEAIEISHIFMPNEKVDVLSNCTLLGPDSVAKPGMTAK